MIKRRHSPYSTSSLYSKSEDSTKTKKKKKNLCIFCTSSKENSANCNLFNDVDVRKTNLRNKRRSFKCAKKCQKMLSEY